ncbi:MAG TPA: peroxiredoxin, partial [Colwellia sp.]|nr:peroxiredoxin [Colwellia sp.]
MKKTFTIACALFAALTSFSVLATDLTVGEKAPNFRLQ